MTPSQVVKYYVTQKAAGDAIGIGQSAVANMVRRGRVPELAQLQWQSATGGKLKADPKILPKSRP